MEGRGPVDGVPRTDLPTRARGWIERFRAARRDEALAVLEGFHALKHAVRFGAPIQVAVTRDPDALQALCQRLAPDVARWMREHVIPVEPAVFQELAPVPPDTGVMAIARRRAPRGEDLLVTSRAAPLVVLEDPSHLGNVGAVVRVAAAAGATGVVTTGNQDPWHPVAIRGAAGLHYAVPVARVSALTAWKGPLVALHPEGEPLRAGSIPGDAILVFGSERRGLSEALLARVDRRVAIPMEPGVSSLNLATAVAVVLYTWRLRLHDEGPSSSR